MPDHAGPEFDPTIGAYYDHVPEESRLDIGPFRLEALRTRELILRHAPRAPANVLDVGGAAGAYAFWLAENGYSVRLIDAVPRLVAIATAKNQNAARPLASCAVGDARAIPERDASVDMVIMLGPLYHLVDARDRHVALAEARRVLRGNGVLIAAAISRWASALDGLSRDILSDPAFARIVERDLLDGHHQNPTDRLEYFTTAYFHRPEELRHEVSHAGFDVEGLYGVEGPGWILSDFTERWSDERGRDDVVRLARMLESEPAMIGTSAHLIVAARKPAAQPTSGSKHA
jgi:SAM-dependent methyltransferase